MPIRKLLAIISALLFLSHFFSTGNAQTKSDFEYFIVGSAADVQTQTLGGLALVGGGTDVEAAFVWMIEHSGGGDFVVLRASGSDDYNPFIVKLGKVNSVETLIIKSRAAANDKFVVEKIRQAEALFIAGGNQANYVNFWKGTPVEEAIQELARKRAPIGGTSAGLSILGEFCFPALKDTITSKEALANPFDEKLFLEKNFLSLPNLSGIITDSHFVERDRMGRLLAFLAYIKANHWAKEARAIAIDRETAVLIDANGQATVRGKNSAYFIRASSVPEVYRKPEPLTYRNISVYRTAGQALFNLKTWRGAGGTTYKISAEKGALISTQTARQIY